MAPKADLTIIRPVNLKLNSKEKRERDHHQMR